MKYLIVLILISFTFAQVPIFNNLFGPFNSRPYLTPTESPTNSIYINWNTEAKESTIVAYGITASLEDTVRIPGIRHYHHTMLTDLFPETEYFYRVVPWGDVKRFKTFPPDIRTLSFVVFGDTQNDSVAHQSVIDRMVSYEFDLMVHAGDLVGNGGLQTEWRKFFNVEDTLLQTHHFFPTIGNHESPFWTYDTLFALPEPEYYYSVSFGSSHFIMLNTEMDLYGAQRDWLINELATASGDTTIDWIFVDLHRPPYSSGHGGSYLDVRDAWCPLFEEYGVDIVFSGHCHSYERTIPINGVVYIVTGGGGGSLFDIDSSSQTAYCEKTYHFCLVNITEQELLLTAIKPDGTLFDGLVINKSIYKEDTRTRYSEGEGIFLSPNPFVYNLVITYAIPTTQNVCLRICDCTGRIIKTFVRGSKEPGTYTISWTGVDNSGNDINAGIYFLIFQKGDQTLTRKIIKID